MLIYLQRCDVGVDDFVVQPTFEATQCRFNDRCPHCITRPAKSGYQRETKKQKQITTTRHGREIAVPFEARRNKQTNNNNNSRRSQAANAGGRTIGGEASGVAAMDLDAANRRQQLVASRCARPTHPSNNRGPGQDDGIEAGCRDRIENGRNERWGKRGLSDKRQDVCVLRVCVC